MLLRRLVFLRMQAFRVARIEGQANEQQEEQAKQHADIRARFVQRAPKPILHERDNLG